MKFENVAIVGVAHVEAPQRITTDELEAPLRETYARFGLPARFLEPLTGVRARRFWDPGTLPSDAATLAARAVLEETGVDPRRIGLLINTSVSRDYLEPSVACFVHAKLGLSETCRNFDLANACLGFLDGMQVIGNLIERGQLDYGLIVDGESSRHVVECTVERLRQPSCDERTVREQLATLTVGSGAAAMVLSHARLAPSGHRFVGAVSLAATQHNQLCRGQADFGATDAKKLLEEGVALAKRTWTRAQAELGLSSESTDLLAMHQVSALNTQELARVLRLDLAKAPLIYPELGNVGPASIPIVLSKAVEQERLGAGDRVVLAGIGSGLNCTAAAVTW
jgi:3-oxoacyl-[acyl-carrier-protein] synthase-3